MCEVAALSFPSSRCGGLGCGSAVKAVNNILNGSPAPATSHHPPPARCSQLST